MEKPTGQVGPAFLIQAITVALEPSVQFRKRLYAPSLSWTRWRSRTTLISSRSRPSRLDVLAICNYAAKLSHRNCRPPRHRVPRAAQPSSSSKPSASATPTTAGTYPESRISLRQAGFPLCVISGHKPKRKKIGLLLVSRTILVRETGNTRCGVDHWLLAHLNEANTWSIKIKYQDDNARD
jgi:hypothetical protein